MNLNGSHTRVQKGGEEVAYQGRKKAQTTNMLFITDRNGCPLACSWPVSGNHNDAFDIKKTVSKMFKKLEQIPLDLRSVFFNGDAGFDVEQLKKLCEKKEIIHNINENRRNRKTPQEYSYVFDSESYKLRFVVEQCNPWVDAFRSLIIRYDTSAKNWFQIHYLAFAIIFLRKYMKLTFIFKII